MNNNFIPYDLCLMLNEIGFDYECIATTDDTDFLHIKGTYYPIRAARFYNTVDCPLWQQAFDWFLEKHRLSSYITTYNNKYYWSIKIIGDKTGTAKGYSQFENNIEDARYNCLKKLIELNKK